MKQLTLKDSFTVKGKGLHTGEFITATFMPAPPHHGYKIQRIDLENKPIIDCLAENVADTQRGTVLLKDGVKVSTIEHAMAALYASRIDNCLIQLDGPEMPILDGSALIFVQEIQRVGLVEQDADKEYFIVKHKIEVKGEHGEHLLILPDEEFSVNAQIAFNSKVLASQFAVLEHVEDFAEEVASARTFVFVREIEPLLNLGLIKGGDLDNAIVIYENELTQERYDALADQIGVPHKDAHHLGYLNNKPLTWPNETARHKLLDIIGDLALVGRPIRGRVIATKPGHTINNPHRYPMQLVDKVIDIHDNYIVGVKNVTSNEPFFLGHFPQEPVMPGVLLVEAMAQAGGLLVLNSVDEPERWSTYFAKIDNVRFRHKVVPGDTLIFLVKLLAPVRRGISSMRGLIFVGDNVVAEAEFTASIVKNK